MIRFVQFRSRVARSNTAQFVEAETGKHVWAERYDRDLAEIFAVQDEITEAVTIAIAPAIAHAEQQRAMRKPPGSLDTWSAYLRIPVIVIGHSGPHAHGNAVTSATLTPTGMYAVTASYDGASRGWRAILRTDRRPIRLFSAKP